jgi:DNA-binding transcriptional ArsR family regulator
MSLAQAYRALGGPTRGEILRLLRQGELPAGHLALDMSALGDVAGEVAEMARRGRSMQPRGA